MTEPTVGSAAGAMTVAGLLRARAAERPEQVAFTFLADGEARGGEPHLRGARPPGGGRGGGARGVGPSGRAGAAALPSRPRLHRGLLRLPLRRSGGRPGLSPPSERPVAVAPAGHRARRHPPRGADHGGDPGRDPGAARAARGGARARRPAVDRDRRPGDGRRRLSAGARSGVARLPPVHLGVDGDAEGGDGHPRQPAAQRADDRRRLRHGRGVGGGGVAAALPRHGPDRERAAAAARGRPVRADAAGGLPAAADALAGGGQPPPGDGERRPQLRLRAVPAQGDPGGAGGPRPLLLAGGVQRRRAGARLDAGAFRRGLRAVRAPAGGALPLLRPGRGDAVRQRRAWLEGGGRTGELRCCGDGAAAGGGRSGDGSRAAGGRGGGDLDRRPERGARLLGERGGHGARLQRLPAVGRGAVPAHGGPRVPRRRRALRHRAAQGPDHPARAQPLSAGRRADGGAGPSRSPARRRRRLLGGDGRGGAAGGRPRGGAPPESRQGRRNRGDRRGGAAGRGLRARGAGAGGGADPPGRPAQDVERQGAAAPLPGAVPPGRAAGGGAERPGGGRSGAGDRRLADPRVPGGDGPGGAAGDAHRLPARAGLRGARRAGGGRRAADRPGARFAVGGGAEGERRGGARPRGAAAGPDPGGQRRELADLLLAGLAARPRWSCRRCARNLSKGTRRGTGRSPRASGGSGSSTSSRPRGAPTTSRWRRASAGWTRRGSVARWRPSPAGTRPCARSSPWWATSRCGGCCRRWRRTSRSWKTPPAWPRRPGSRSRWRPGRCCGRGSSRGRTARRSSCSWSITSWPTSPRWR